VGFEINTTSRKEDPQKHSPTGREQPHGTAAIQMAPSTMQAPMQAYHHKAATMQAPTMQAATMQATTATLQAATMQAATMVATMQAAPVAATLQATTMTSTKAQPGLLQLLQWSICLPQRHN